MLQHIPAAPGLSGRHPPHSHRGHHRGVWQPAVAVRGAECDGWDCRDSDLEARSNLETPVCDFKTKSGEGEGGGLFPRSLSLFPRSRRSRGQCQPIRAQYYYN